MRNLAFLLLALNLGAALYITTQAQWPVWRAPLTAAAGGSRGEPDWPQRLVAVTEVPELAAARDAAANAGDDIAAVAAAGEGRCREVGDFATAEEALALAADYRAREVPAVAARREVPEPRPDYLVLVPPAQDRAVAQRLRSELTAVGVEAFLVVDGPLANGLSVGVFSDRENARRRLEEVTTLGYPVVLQEVPRTRARYGVVVPAGGVWQRPELDGEDDTRGLCSGFADTRTFL